MMRTLIYCLILVWPILGYSRSEFLDLQAEHLLVTQFDTHTVAYVHPQKGVIDRVKVGQAPYGIVNHNDEYAYISTANGVAVLNIKTRQRVALIPFGSEITQLGWGEYRQGGMGIAVSPDGQWLAVGVYLGQGKPSQLEIISTQSHQVMVQVPVGERPFQVLFSPDGQHIYSIDHDSYSVTSLSLKDQRTRTFNTAPLGYGAFSKPHYGAFDAHGRLLLPIQGRVLLALDPNTGEQEQFSLTAATHQHGVTMADDGRLFVVGTGPAGNVKGTAKLTIIDRRYKEKHIALTREHEQVILSADGRSVYMTGGNSYTGGWDGITVINLDDERRSEIAVDGQPLGVALWRVSARDER